MGSEADCGDHEGALLDEGGESEVEEEDEVIEDEPKPPATCSPTPAEVVATGDPSAIKPGSTEELQEPSAEAPNFKESEISTRPSKPKEALPCVGPLEPVASKEEAKPVDLKGLYPACVGPLELLQAPKADEAAPASSLNFHAPSHHTGRPGSDH